MPCSRLIRGGMLLGLVLACGGGGGGGSTPAPALSTGMLVDSPVIGLPYTAGSRSGLTGAGGQFTYPAGATVTFSLGGLLLPAVAGAAFLTPLDLFAAETFNDARAVNLARLLQTLDEDGDPDNGLSIPAAAHQAAAGLTLSAWDAPDFDAQLAPLLQALGNPPLVTGAAAASHLMGQSIVGTWYFEEPVATRLEFFTFLPDGTVLYGVHAPNHTSEPITGGIQRADYTWDPTTGALAIHNLNVNTAGTWGLAEPATGLASVVWQVTGTATAMATMTRVGHGATTLPMKRLTSPPGPLAGTWLLRPVGRDLTLLSLAIFPGDCYASIELGQADLDGGPGLDFGTYTFNPSSGLFTGTPIADTSGGWGITRDAATPESATLTLSGSTLLNDQVPPETLLRLEP